MGRTISPAIASVFLMMAAPALAIEARPVIAPPEQWVTPADIPAFRPDTDTGAVTVLLADQQARLGEEGDAQFVETAIRLGSPQALSGAALALGWDPAVERLTIHRYRLLRDGKPIDLLGDGSKLTIVRRETNLERATLDGQLTATFQPEDVRVGDIVDIAYTLVRRDPSLGGRSQLALTLGPGLPVRRARLRLLWPAAKPVTWAASPGAFTARERTLGKEREVVAELVDATTARPPRGAPLRYQIVNTLFASDMGQWADVSRLLAPLFATAATLAPDSPVAAAAARIAASTPDPERRMLAALRLVQDEIRYVLLTINDGGYRPAAADETWARKFGDCKGKTALLLALLNALHIEARPALVNSRLGDGLDKRLPMLSAFDHVIVEARVGGRSYWLDGTRSGDRSLAGLKTPDVRWALPVTASGAALVALPREELDKPQEATSIRIDASKGLFVPATLSAERRLEGELALGYRLLLQPLPAAERERQLKQFWQRLIDDYTPQDVAMIDDEASGTLRLTTSGTARLDWQLFNRHRYYWLDGARFATSIDPTREAGPDADAPFAVDHPVWSESSETIILPNRGQGFTTDGRDVDTRIGVFAFRRTTAIADGVVTMRSSVRTLGPELPFAGITAIKAALDANRERGVSVDAPDVYAATDADLAALDATTPATPEAWAERGRLRFARNDFRAALADFDGAIAARPDDGYAHGMRAVTLAWLGDPRSEEAAARALALDPRESRAWNARAIRAMKAGQYPEAETALTTSIGLWSQDPWSLSRRAEVRLAMNNVEGALADLAAARALSPGDEQLILRQAAQLSRLGRDAEAARVLEPYCKAHPKAVQCDIQQTLLAIAGQEAAQALPALDALVARHPGDVAAIEARGYERRRLGDRNGAIADLSTVIAARPDPFALITRAILWAISDRAHWDADLQAAERLNPSEPSVLKTRAWLETRAGNFPAADTALGRAEALFPGDPQLGTLRLQLLSRQGRKAEFVALAESLATRNGGTNAQLWNELCWAKATMNIKADTALADCDRAIQLDPRYAPALDSRAFVRLRQGQLDGAIADADAALALEPELAAALYVRGIARLRKGQDGAADLAKARAIAPGIDRLYAGYGVTPPN